MNERTGADRSLTPEEQKAVGVAFRAFRETWRWEMNTRLYEAMEIAVLAALRSASREPAARPHKPWNDDGAEYCAVCGWAMDAVRDKPCSGEPAPRRSNPFNEDVLEAIAAWLMRIQRIETLDVAHRREALELRRVLLQGARGEPAPREPSEAFKPSLDRLRQIVGEHAGDPLAAVRAGGIGDTAIADCLRLCLLLFPPTRDPGSLTIREVP